jgi:hypothetical protein
MAKNKITFLDLHRQDAEIKSEIHQAANSVFDRSLFILREGVDKFEAAFSKYRSDTDILSNSGSQATAYLAFEGGHLGVTRTLYNEVLSPALSSLTNDDFI